MKKTKEYRYQFIRFENVYTGKYITVDGIFGSLGSLGNHPITKQRVKETKEVAVVFDKEKGIVLQRDIKSDYAKNK